MKKAVRGAEVGKQGADEAPLTREQIVEEIQKNKFIPKEFKAVLIRNIDIPERVKALEEALTKLEGMPDEVVRKLNAQAAARAETIKGELAGLGRSQQGGIRGNIVEQAIARMLLGGGSNAMNEFFVKLGEQTFFERVAWGDILMREQIKGMGKEFKKQVDKRREELISSVGGSKK